MSSNIRVGIKDSIATKLLRTVFGFYLIVAVTVTAIHMIVEYNYQKDNILQGLISIQKGYEQGLAVNMWQLNREALETLVRGMVESSEVVGVKIQNEKGENVAISGNISQQGKAGHVGSHTDFSGLSDSEMSTHEDGSYPFDLFEHVFLIKYNFEGKIKFLGKATIYSSSTVIYHRVKLGFVMLIANALLKTVALWLIFLLFAKYMLRKPLEELTSATKKITLGKLDSFKVNIKTTNRNELKLLEESFNSMIENLHHSIVTKENAEREHRILFESMTEGVVYQDAGGTIVGANPAALQLLGLSLDQMQGKTSISPQRKLIHEDGSDFSSETHPAMIVLNTGKKCENVIMGVHYPDKGIYKWVNINSVPQFLPNESAPHQVFSTFSDITERKQAEETLRKSKELYSLFVEGTDNLVTQVDQYGNFTFVNYVGEILFGINKDKLIGMSAFQFIHPEDHEKTQHWFDECANKQLSQSSMENRQINQKTGAVNHMLWTSHFIYNEKKELIEINGIAHNITKRIIAEEQIKASLNEKETLLKEIHHRVKNNMQVVSSLLKLQSNKSNNEGVRAVLKESQNRVFAMSAVHETLYRSDNLSKIEAGPFINKIIKFVFKSYQINPLQVKLKTEFDDIKLNIEQATPLGLVINELASNTLKHAFPKGKKGEFSIDMKKLDDNELELTIKDNGVGFPAEANWKNQSGLGLQLVKALVEKQLKGTLQVAESKSSQFIIRFKNKNLPI